MTFIRALLTNRLAAIVAAAVVLGQVSLVLHDVVVQHELETACEVCVVKDRLADAVIADSVSPAVLFAAILLPAVAFYSVFARRVATARPRGPPIL